jgi:beta-glucosidase
MKGRTYRYMTAEPLYPFGFGLSYTSFAYSGIKLSTEQVKKNVPVTASVTVTNAGKVDADEVVQLYITNPDNGENPLFSLKGFKRVSLKAGESRSVDFELTPELLQSINNDGRGVQLTGDYHIYLGGSLPTQRSQDLGMPKCAMAVLHVK